MEMQVFGGTGMQLSVLGFGCGAVGGLVVRGDPLDQERTVARAVDAGVNYFDTAVQYGNGESEKNLGRVLQTLKPTNVVVGTKVRLPSGDEEGIVGKWLAMLKEMAPQLARVAILFNAKTEQFEFAAYRQTAEADAHSLGIQLVLSPGENAAEIEHSITSFAQTPNGGLLVPP